MAVFTIQQAIDAINGLGQKYADRAVAIMKEEVPVRTGKLRDSITAHNIGQGQWEIGPEAVTDDGRNFPYPVAVRTGRSPIDVAPNYLKIHASTLKHPNLKNTDDLGYIYTHKVAGTEPNDYITRTKQRLEQEHIGL